MIKKETEMPMWYKIISLDVLVRKIKRIETEGEADIFICECSLFESRGETEGEILSLVFGKIPSKKQIKNRLIQYFETERKK